MYAHRSADIAVHVHAHTPRCESQHLEVPKYPRYIHTRTDANGTVHIHAYALVTSILVSPDAYTVYIHTYTHIHKSRTSDYIYTYPYAYTLRCEAFWTTEVS
jgi:hypothetical protein